MDRGDLIYVKARTDSDESNQVNSSERRDLYTDADDPVLKQFWDDLKDLAKYNPEGYLYLTKIKMPNDSLREILHSMLLPNYKDLWMKGLESTHPTQYRVLKTVLTEAQWKWLGSLFLLEDKPLEECANYATSIAGIYLHLGWMLSFEQWNELEDLLWPDGESDGEGRNPESSDDEDIFNFSYEDLEAADQPPNHE